MHRIRCIVISAMGGFKINGPPKNGKGLMSNEENQELSNKVSLPQPTQAGRIETCTELISKARRCLENNGKDCVIKMIEELVRNQCHNGNAVGKEVADEVKDEVHELWLVSNNEYRCRLLMLFRDLGMPKIWVKKTMLRNRNTKTLNKWLRRCGIEWESKVTRNDAVKVIEDLLRSEFSWSETKMCEEMWKFVGIDVNEFRRYGIEPCIWLDGLELLSDLRNPYWFGLVRSDMVVREHAGRVELKLDTTNSVSAIFFPALLGTVKAPSLIIEWGRKRPTMRYVSKSINLIYYITLGVDEWPWPIKLSINELERIKGFTDEELAMFIAGLLDGDGSVLYRHGHIFVEITFCRDCPKRVVHDVLKKVIAEKLGIISYIRSTKETYKLTFYDENAVRLLRHVVMYMHHPLRRLRAELILALYDGKIDYEKFKRLYKQTKYKRGAPDIKRNNGLDVLARAAPQTHTHREPNTNQNRKHKIKFK